MDTQNDNTEDPEAGAAEAANPPRQRARPRITSVGMAVVMGAALCPNVQSMQKQVRRMLQRSALCAYGTFDWEHVRGRGR